MKKLWILLLFITTLTMGSNLHEIRDILKHVETDYRPEIIGDFGKSYGILQIGQKVITDVNRIYGTSYVHGDAFDINCAEEIFELYIKYWTGKLEKREAREATEEDIVRIWNGGPQGWRRNSTLDYLHRYKKYKIDMSLNTRNCYITGKVGTIVATYNYTVDIYVFKLKRIKYGVSKKSIKLIPPPVKPVNIQLALAL